MHALYEVHYLQNYGHFFGEVFYKKKPANVLVHTDADEHYWHPLEHLLHAPFDKNRPLSQTVQFLPEHYLQFPGQVLAHVFLSSLNLKNA